MKNNTFSRLFKCKENHKGRIPYNHNDVQDLPESFESNRLKQQRAQGATIFKALAHLLVGVDSTRSIMRLRRFLWWSAWDVRLWDWTRLDPSRNFRGLSQEVRGTFSWWEWTRFDPSRTFRSLSKEVEWTFSCGSRLDSIHREPSVACLKKWNGRSLVGVDSIRSIKNLP